ncbi:MAG TPA: hypothetical protein VFH95_04165, partial [Candidatus Kapabacteria bacterium]|nr:hypothetical protein [Candidatus Kapabacteria bacterium]
MLEEFEHRYASEIDRIPADKRADAGSLLSVIPLRPEWEEFRIAVRAAWPWWEDNLNLYPASLIILYASIAFFEYEAGEIWGKFAEATGTARFTPN